MPSITFTSDSPLVANVHLEAPAREASAVDAGDGLVSVEVATIDVGARFVGPADQVANMLADAVDALARLRGAR